jgi:hypothetical protein
VLAPWDLERNHESVYADRDANFPYMGGIGIHSPAVDVKKIKDFTFNSLDESVQIPHMILDPKKVPNKF